MTSILAFLCAATLVFGISHNVRAQVRGREAAGVDGMWMGALALEISFRIVLTIRANGTSMFGSMDVPDQNARNVPLTEVRVARDSVYLRIAPAAILFAGRMNGTRDSIVGMFAQGSQAFSVVLVRPSADQLSSLQRAQDPKLPFPYREEEVRIPSGGIAQQQLNLFTPTELSALGYTAAMWNDGTEVYLSQLPWFRYWLVLDPLPL